MPKASVLIVDDHLLIRYGLKQMLSDERSASGPWSRAGGVRFYPVEGKLCSESEIVSWTETGRS